MAKSTQGMGWAREALERARVDPPLWGRGALWPDGVPVDPRTFYVRLACGHERVSRGWRGDEGQVYCCDACHRLTTIERVRETTVEPFGWRWTVPRPSADPAEQIRWGLEYLRRRYPAVAADWRTYVDEEYARYMACEHELADRVERWQRHYEEAFAELAMLMRPRGAWWSRAVAWGIAVYYLLRR